MSDARITATHAIRVGSLLASGHWDMRQLDSVGLKRALGAVLGFGLAVAIIRNSGDGTVFLRDLVLAWTLFTYGLIRLWRRLSQMPTIGPIAAWHGGQLMLAVVAGAVLVLVCTMSLNPFFRAFAKDIAESSIPRLLLLGIAYPIVACPIFLFWLSWVWFAGRGRR